MIKFTLLFLLCFPFSSFAQYTGTASVTQGLATATTGNLYTCPGGRVAKLGTIAATDNTMWTVPAAVNFTNTAFPFASNLHNTCTGAPFTNAAAALAALDGSDIVQVDAEGEVITAYIFADNYFEMYINGVAVGKDNVPYTQFNSNIVRFKVKRPFTIALLLVDWEENLGVGSEVSGPAAYHDGDGGMVAVFADNNNDIVAITDHNWKAQTFYTAPITDLGCATENGSSRFSGNCSTQDSNNGTGYYGLHWARPADWTTAAFNDNNWPSATEYTNAVIGVNNKPAYTNFTNIFDDPANDAAFIWSTNVILDNEVIVRHTVQAASNIPDNKSPIEGRKVYPNPFHAFLYISPATTDTHYELMDAMGRVVYTGKKPAMADFSGLPNGIYYLKMTDEAGTMVKVMLHE
jgi:hypothetical protein